MLKAEVRGQGRRKRYGLVAAVMVIAATSLLAHDPITTKITWDREIAPLVQARCVSCHSAGGRGPMPLTTYQEARPWARAIREEVLTRRMPKWHVVRGYGDFVDDPSLSSFEIALFVAWADGGAPEHAKASAAGKAASKSADKPAVRPGDTAPPARPRTRTRIVDCTSQTVAAGRLAGIEPVLARGASLKLMVKAPDASQEPLVWIRDFDPAFAESYRLRNPLTIASGTRLDVLVTPDPSAPCRITLHYEI
jgi:hypothetical protein